MSGSPYISHTSSMMEKLPDHLALLLETLISRNCITSWNIYQNKNKNTCVTIRFNDSDPQISPHKYRRISDRQMNRNISRAQMFQSVQTLDHDNSPCDTDIDRRGNKRRKFDTSPEVNRSNINFPAHEDLKSRHHSVLLKVNVVYQNHLCHLL